MKSIEDTLRIIQDIIKTFPSEVAIALVGGYASVLHGVERTTLDIDFCIYSGVIHSSHGTDEFYGMLSKYIPERFKATLIKGSTIPDDPFKHDVIFIEDTLGEYMRMDLLIAKYKWELQAIHSASRVEGIPVPVMTKPYLTAMKLRATGYKDASDVVSLVRLMTEAEREKTFELAKLIGRDKKLAMLLSPPEEGYADESAEELI